MKTFAEIRPGDMGMFDDGWGTGFGCYIVLSNVLRYHEPIQDMCHMVTYMVSDSRNNCSIRKIFHHGSDIWNYDPGKDILARIE